MTEQNKSGKILAYSIAAFFIVLTIIAVLSFGRAFVNSKTVNPKSISIRSDCKNDTAYVFIDANDNLKNVRCFALDSEYLQPPTVSLGDLSKYDEDVCRFKISEDAPEHLRFEIKFNDYVRREVCQWQSYSYSYSSSY